MNKVDLILVLLEKLGADRKRRRGVSPLWGVGAVPTALFGGSRYYSSKAEKTVRLADTMKSLADAEESIKGWEKRLRMAEKEKDRLMRRLEESRRIGSGYSEDLLTGLIKDEDKNIREAKDSIQRYERKARELRRQLPEELRNKSTSELEGIAKNLFGKAEKFWKRNARLVRAAAISAAIAAPTYGYLTWRAIKRRKKR